VHFGGPHQKEWLDALPCRRYLLSGGSWSRWLLLLVLLVLLVLRRSWQGLGLGQWRRRRTS